MEVAQYYANRYHDAMRALNVLPPSIEPQASGHIIEQIELVKEILKNGYAYESEGSVYFDVAKYNKDHHYGKLSGRNLEDVLNTTPANWTARKRSTIPPTSPSGRRRSPSTSCAGRLPGATDSPAGTASARPWDVNIWAHISTSTGAVWTSSSRTTSVR